MRLFKRRCSDPNPQLESLSTLSEIDGNITKFCRVPSSENVEVPKSKPSSWGRTWGKQKSDDSSGQLQRSASRARHWSPLKKDDIEVKNSSFKSRDEKSELKLSQSDLRKVYDMYRNMNDRVYSRPQKNLKNKRKVKCISENLELSQQQLLDYLVLMKPSGEELDTIFSEISEKNLKSDLDCVSEEKRSKTSRFKSFFSRSSSKSDDESDLKLHPKNSSTDSLTGLLNFIIPRRYTSNLQSKIKSDESGYGSDSTKAASIDSPVASIKSTESISSREHINEDDCDKTINKYSLKSSKKRCRSSDENDTLALPRNKSIKLKKSPKKNGADDNMLVEDIRQHCCLDFKNLKINDENNKTSPPHRDSKIIEKEFKCIRLQVAKGGCVGVRIGPNYGHGSMISYSITDILPNSAASRNGNLKLGDEVVKLNGTRIRGCPLTLAKRHLEPKNGELEIVVARLPLPLESTNRSGKRANGCLKVNTSVSTLPTFSRTLISRKNDFVNPVKNVVSSNTPAINRNRLVGLSDILSIKHDDMESRVTFSQNPRSSNNHENDVSAKSQAANEHTTSGMRKFSHSSNARDISTRGSNGLEKNTVQKQKKHVILHKGSGCKSLGFSIVGGRDTPKGPMGIYVKTIFPEGQASESGIMRQGDEIISINGVSFDGLSHTEALSIFKRIKCGDIVMELVSRQPFKFSSSL